MKKIAIFFKMVLVVWLLVSLSACTKPSSPDDAGQNSGANQESGSGQTGESEPGQAQSGGENGADMAVDSVDIDAIESGEPMVINLPTSDDRVDAPGDIEYVNEKYGFAFKYNMLMMDDTISGNQFVELKHLSGDMGIVSIRKPEKWELEDPEATIRNAFMSGDYEMVRREELMLGEYPAVLGEFMWEVMGSPLQTMILETYKDGLYYSVAVNMNPLYVEDVRTEFDIVINSFRLLDTGMKLEVFRPWAEAFPQDYPFDLLEPYKLDQVIYTFGDSMEEGFKVSYYAQDDVPYEEIKAYYHSLLEGAPDFDPNVGRMMIDMQGTLEGYFVTLGFEHQEASGNNVVKMEVTKQ